MDDESNDPNSPETYQAMCRGDIGVPVQISSRLTCRYLTENHPFLKIAPFKIETVYINPDVIIFHDVLSDGEINSMKELAKPRLRRARVQDPITGEKVPSEERISKSAITIEKYFNIFATISRRAMHMTGLSMEKTGEIQMANYGIGGYYSAHHDFVNNNTYEYIKGGRIIATLLFYVSTKVFRLSSVSRGGATVFPYLGVSVPPIKGAALFWYNLHSSGEPNHAMLHAGGQELIKPFNLEYQPEGINDKIPSPMLKETRERRLFEEYKPVPLRQEKRLPQNQEDIEVHDE
ncbi:unnamed protein product [Arctia plantaginis]|uniref:Fe2OG dioxygenase domain-containing protein n=1 Tax=Arctia plantaginis TaxID=874455 RepID=A0A8S0ZE97_ARCPL|nr:unnamed protein product [Arctia plantaginis]